jgi:hypothetical protein
VPPSERNIQAVQTEKEDHQMDKVSENLKYETPCIEDHGSLTELTAGGTVGTYADAEVTLKKGESLSGSGHAQTSP